MSKPPHKEVNRFGAARNGLKLFFRTEVHAKVHGIAALMAIGMGFLFHIERLEWALLVLCIILVTGLEIINTAIEVLCDKIEPNYHQQIKVVKDMAASAVLVAAIGSLLIGCFIFLPKVYTLLFSG